MELSELELKLANMFDRNYCVVVGSGTMALVLLFKAIGLNERHRPLFPATSCISAFNASVFAGSYPEFSDISLQDYTIDPQNLEQVLQSNHNIKAIVPTQLFGHVCNMEEIHDIAHKCNVFVIEDAAQSMGAQFKGKRSGSFGQASILSFGHTKIADAGHGGAILIDDKSLFHEIVNLNSQNKHNYISINQLAALEMEYRSKYYESISKGSAWEATSSENLRSLNSRYESCFTPPFNTIYIDKIETQLATISDEIKLRNEKDQLYRYYIKRNDILMSSTRQGSTSWRFTFRISEEKRDLLLRYLRTQNIHCSSWYPYYPRLYGDNTQLNGIQFEREVINLWVDKTYSKSEIKQICEKINHWEGA